ncbi:MAG: Stp1/IreP family PP2C-type Ser/Thr phosphatase [Thermodesulfobacteriota bacterium]
MSQIIIGAASDPGMRRKENQDSHTFFCPPEGTAHKKGILMALADGMGGHAGGSVASKLAVDTLLQTYYEDSDARIPESLERSFLAANQKVIEKSRSDLQVQGMGSTLTAVVFQGTDMYHAHVGDSRGYSIFAKQMTQFTEDHSYVASLVKAGAISPEEARTHPEGNIITRAIGFQEELKVDASRTPVKIHKDQFILMCCDGLYKEVPEEEILAAVHEFKDPEIICRKLIEKANTNGGHDNITILVARIDGVERAPGLLNRLKRLLR